MDVVRTVRRVLRPVRGHARRVRARWGDLDALLEIPNLRTEDIRWVARKAQARGDAALAKEALIVLVRNQAATEEEERRLRAMASPMPAAPADSAASPAEEPARSGVELVISRDAADGRPVGRLTDLGGRIPPDIRTVSAWQDEWSRLPRSLGDQLAVCALTRVAHLNGVGVVRSDDPSTGVLAAAVAHAVGARNERMPEYSEDGRE